MSTHWSDARERGAGIAYWGMKAMLAMYQLGGRPLFALILYPVMVWFFVSSRTARQASRDYFQHLVQTDPSLHIQPSLRLSWRHFLSFADVILDKLTAWSGGVTPQSVNCIGHQMMLARLAQQQGGILLTAHLGNLEAMQALSEHNGALVLNILVYTRHAEQFNRLLASRQLSSKVRLIQVESINPALAVDLSQRIAAGEWLVIAADRVPVASERTLEVEFLGANAALPLGPHLLSLLLGCPLVLAICIKQQGQYNMYFETLSEKLAISPNAGLRQGLNRQAARQQCLQISAQLYANRLAHYCRLAPLQWFNFYFFWRGNTKTK